ncbi:preprotein translocase subunit YajC [Agaribacterium sp. ZY112]|uniref:preprotein translocase subunit YajC n=1 Tax=Agaribacterium sp. ZY112 TaxID=3233574 RepID=UPI003523C129
MSFFIAEAAAQAQASAPAASPNAGFLNILLLGGLFVFMYFMIIRPQRKRQKEHQSLVDALGKGDEVVMSSGLLGKIVEVDEAYVTIKAADSVELKFQKASVHAVLPKGTIKAI